MYPPIAPYETKWVHVDNLHGSPVKIYVEWSGNPKGIPVIYCHGGPGDRSTPYLRRLYNPKKYNIILFDQRGCGKSLPKAHLEKNTTALLIRDMETIRNLKGYDRWIVSGGSWGSSLAMMYAQAYPERVSGLILRGIYDLSQPTVVDEIFPEIHDEINELVEYKKGNRFKKILHSLQTRKSRRLANLLMDITPMYVKTKRPRDKENPFQMALVNAHYEANHYFVPKRQIYQNMHKIRHIPTFMVNGRWDIVTPASIAYRLSQQMDNCTLIFVDAGHTVFEKAIGDQLVKCSDLMSKNAIKKD